MTNLLRTDSVSMSSGRHAFTRCPSATAILIVLCLVWLAPARGLAAGPPGTGCVTEILSLGSYDPARLPAELAVPGYNSSPYNVVVMGTWFADGTALDALTYWTQPTSFMLLSDQQALTGLPAPTDAQIRASIRALDSSAGITRLAGAFYATDSPIADGRDPATTAAALANYVSTHDLDGVLVAFEESAALSPPSGAGEAWLATFTTQLRTLLGPSAIIAHAPQAPYFAGLPYYPAGGYLTVHSNVGSLIDWYLVRYYNQGSTSYDTEQTLVQVSNGWATNTALEQVIAAGVPASQLYVSKPATVTDASGGYVSPAALETILTDNPTSWGGVGGFQFASDEAASFAFGNTLCAAAAPPPVPSVTLPTAIALSALIAIVALPLAGRRAIRQ